MSDMHHPKLHAHPVQCRCAAHWGFSRSALAVAAWLLDTQHTRTTAEALAQVRRARPAMAINATQEMALNAWWKQRPCGTIGT